MKFLINRAVYLVALFQAALVLLVAFGLDFTPEQIAAMVAFFSAVLALVAGTIVSSPATVAVVATDAATRTAERLATDTVGAVGNVTKAGGGVVNEVVGEVLGEVGGLVGSLTKGK